MTQESTRLALLEQQRIEMSNTINDIKTDQKSFKNEVKQEFEKLNNKIDCTNDKVSMLINRINLWVGGAVVLITLGQIFANHFLDKL
jgi:hypothetical protein